MTKYTKEEKQEICEQYIKFDCAGCPLNDCGGRK
jgi:hypothetical protein